MYIKDHNTPQTMQHSDGLQNAINAPFIFILLLLLLIISSSSSSSSSSLTVVTTTVKATMKIINSRNQIIALLRFHARYNRPT